MLRSKGVRMPWSREANSYSRGQCIPRVGFLSSVGDMDWYCPPIKFLANITEQRLLLYNCCVRFGMHARIISRQFFSALYRSHNKCTLLAFFIALFVRVSMSDHRSQNNPLLCDALHIIDLLKKLFVRWTHQFNTTPGYFLVSCPSVRCEAQWGIINHICVIIRYTQVLGLAQPQTNPTIAWKQLGIRLQESCVRSAHINDSYNKCHTSPRLSQRDEHNLLGRSRR